MDTEQLKEDVLAGRITIDRLIEVIVALTRELQAARQELDQATQRIAELDRRLGDVAPEGVGAVRGAGGRTTAGGPGKEAADANAGETGRAKDDRRKGRPGGVGREDLPAAELFPEPETAQVAGQRAVEPVGAALGKRV